jgi:hypothetical protein
MANREAGSASERKGLLDVSPNASIQGPTSAAVFSEVGPLVTCGVPRNLANVLTMAFGYLCLFTAFQTTQILAGALLGNLGTISIAVLYAVFVSAGFVAPAIARGLGPKAGLVAGGLTYCLFMASLVYIVSPVVLLCSAIIGGGASVLWCSQGMMISQCTNESNKSTYFALFWGIFNLCVIPGNIVGHFLLQKKAGADGSAAGPPPAPAHGIPLVIGFSDPNSYLFIFLFFAGIAGIFVMLLLRKPDAAHGSKAEVEERPVKEQVVATFSLMLQPRYVPCATRYPPTMPL